MVPTYARMVVMNKLLAIDTSSTHSSVGLLVNGELISRTSDAERQAAQQILPMISQLLAEAETTLAQLDAIVVMAGPGSFTGLRIGIGVAQGLSLANSTPAIALSSLAVLAMAAIRESEASAILVSQQARDDEIYFGAYLSCEQAGVRLLGSEQVCAPGQLTLEQQDQQPPQDWYAVGDGWGSLQSIEFSLKLGITLPVLRPQVSIQDLIDLAKLRLALGEAVDAEHLQPNYIKEQMDYSQSA